MSFTPSENPITHPTRESYIELRPFRFWCQKVLPLVYDDSLSYYELLCKVVDYLNKTMEDVDHMNTDINTLYGSFDEFQEDIFSVYNELVTYVNNYFDNLNVQEEINNKLDEMVTSGELVTLLRPTIADEISEWLDEHITPTTPSIDDTLGVSGAGADAKKTGDAISMHYNSNLTYKKGDYVLYNGTVYVCISDINTSEAWTSSHWSETNLGNELSYFKKVFVDYTLQMLPYFILKNYYVNTTGEIQVYNGWDCTDYISVKGISSIVTKSNVASGYNVFYDKDKNKISDFIVGTNYNTRKVPDNAEYVVFSNTHEGMNNLEATFNLSVMNVKHIFEEVNISHLTDMGVYHIDRVKFSNMLDKPSDSDDAVATLINYCGAYAGGNFTIQNLYQLSGKEWTRVVNTQTNEMAYDWRRTDAESMPFELAINAKNNLNGYLYLGEWIPETYINVNSGGVIAVYEGWSSTDFIEIPDSIRPNLVTYSPILTDFNGFYTENKEFISNFRIEIGTTKINIPDNAKYIRLSNTTQSSSKMFIYGVFQPYSNYLRGKKIVTAGDSYTAANWNWSEEYSEYNDKNFGYYIASRNGMSFKNDGISGSTMAIPTNGQGHNPFVVDRYLNVPLDADYLTLWFGINDSVNCTLGSITDGDNGTPVNNTFYGAWNTVLKYYLTNRPWLRILIIVPTGASDLFTQAVRDVAEKWGYPYLDWVNDKSIPAFFDRTGMCEEARDLRRDAFGYNGPNEGHPNPEWYEYESTIIEAKLRSI